MKVCVFGAGAIGGHVAARLAAKNAAEISVITRGAHLEAIKERGITLDSEGEIISGKPAVATSDPMALPPQDLVIVALKTSTLPSAADAIARLLGDKGNALFLLNGIPWWWRYGLPGSAETLPLLDPESALWNRVRPQHVVGSVVYSPNDVTAPGMIEHRGFNRYIFGEPDGSSSARLQAVVELFTRGGMKAEATPDIRRQIWRKLVTNAAGNPLCALTRLTLGEMGADPGLGQLMAQVAREVMAVAATLGWDISKEIDLAKVAARTEHKPGVRASMLQDMMLKRPLEVEAHLGQVQAFGREKNVAVPAIDVVLPLLRGLDQGLQLGR
jgi:2-dehydropantoate 2-reductase